MAGESQEANNLFPIYNLKLKNSIHPSTQRSRDTSRQERG